MRAEREKGDRSNEPIATTRAKKENFFLAPLWRRRAHRSMLGALLREVATVTVTARSPEARAMQVPLADRTNTRASSEDDAPM